MHKFFSIINKVLTILVVITLTGQSIVQAQPSQQDGKPRIDYSDSTGKVVFIGADANAPLVVRAAKAPGLSRSESALAMIAQYQTDFGLRDAKSELQLLSEKQVGNRNVTRFQQVYKGIPVIAGELVVNATDSAGLLSLSGEVAPELDINPKPTITAQQATETAAELLQKNYDLTASEFTFTTPELWIYDSRLLQPDGTAPVLVWRIEAQSNKNLPINEFILIDTTRGHVVLNFNQVDAAWHGEQPKTIEEPSAPSKPDLAGVTWYVATTGNDSNNCSTTSTPCATIQAALDKASANDTIRVAQGTYQGNSAIVSITKSISILGGWNSTFSQQVGSSTLDGIGASPSNGIFHVMQNSTLERFIVKNSSIGIFINNGSTCPISVSVNLRQVAIINTSGAIHNCGTVLVENSTIAYNNGIGVDNFTGTVVIKNSTIAFNSASASGQFIGGGIKSTSGSVNIQNSILYGNTGYEGVSQDCSGELSSSGHNIIGTLSGCYITPQSSDLVGVDPKLNYLLSNGYMPLMFDSPAIDVGNPLFCPSIDQRGVSRPQNAICDIGAYEYTVAGNAVGLEIANGDWQHAAPNYEFLFPFVVIPVDANGTPVSNIDVTFTAPNTGASGTFVATGTNVFSTVSDTNGVAIASVFQANNQSGTYTLNASADGLTDAVFNLHNGAWYVSATGNDANSCLLPSNACATINGALNKATSGDGIFVATGTYYGTGNQVVLINKDIVLSGGWNADFTARIGLSTIDAEDAYRIGIKITSENTFIDYFTIQNSSYLGGIFAAGGNVTISNSNIISNNQDGIHTFTSNITLINSLVANNTGSGISSNSDLEIYNSTISGNMSNSYQDAGLYLDGTDPIRVIKNSTITNNKPRGITVEGSGNAILNNSIVISNIPFNSSPVWDCSTDFGNSIISKGYNILGNITGCNFIESTGDMISTPENPIYIRMTPLQNNGGPTLTHALMETSPAIDAGNPSAPDGSEFACLSTDQRGSTRPTGTRCDIGAYEGSVPWAPPPATVVTYTANNITSLPGILLCNQSQPNCTNGLNVDADLAHKYALGVYDFYKTYHYRDSIDNNSMPIISTVKYGASYQNAFWNGSQMVYGDGYSLADDVVAHELTHGVTQYESNLFYYYQSGAINESLSDVWGELYDQENGQGNDTSDVRWLMGEDLPGGVIRSMSNPTIYSDPDKMTSTYYNTTSDDNGGVHTNSGINNKAVYLMVDGGTFNGKTVTALGANKTLAIYYEAQTNLLSSGSDYGDLYNILYQACLNLINGPDGITNANCLEVRDATDAVEMNLQPITNPTFNTDAPLCGPSQTAVPAYQDGFENGLGSWTINNGSTLRWQLDSPYGAFAHSGSHFLYGNDYPQTGTVTDATARWSSKLIPAGAYLHFAHAYDFEYYGSNYYDGGVLEYSTNNGASWIDAGSLINYNGYKGPIYSAFNNPLRGRSAFVGSSHGYISTRVNLASLAGQNVSFRWRMGLDDSVFSWGWWLDDVQIYTCSNGPVISGTTGISGVVLSYTDGTAKSATSDASGNYSLNVTNGWSGTVTPSHACYSFSPANIAFTNVQTSQSNQNFTPTLLPNKVCTLTIARSGTSPTNAASVDFTVTFTTGVTGVDVSDFSLSTTGGVSGPSVTSITPVSASVYTVSVSTGSGNGTIRLDVPNSATISDLSSNALSGLPFNNGEVYAINKMPTSATFDDVPMNHPYWADIEILYANGYTAGCSTSAPLLFCPETTMNRAQSAVFMVRGNFGTSYSPPAAPWTTFGDDFSPGPWAQPWAQGMFDAGLTAGCSTNPRLFCPWEEMPRFQAAVFGMRLREGINYPPPTGTGTVFADIDGSEWYAGWVEQAYLNGLLPACGSSGGSPLFCPNDLVPRGLAAYMIVRAKNLTMP